MRCIAPLLTVTRLFNKTRCEVRCEDLIFRMQAPVSHVHITSGHERTHHPMKSEPYSQRTSHRVLLKSRVTASNGAIQRTRPVPRACSAIQLRYTAALYSIQPIHYTALCADPLVASRTGATLASADSTPRVCSRPLSVRRTLPTLARSSKVQ